MKKRGSRWLRALALVSLQVSATDLSTQLDQFFTARNGQQGASVKVVIKTPQAQWPPCANPQFALPGNGRLWGMMSVAADCGQNRRYIQVQVQVTGSYVVASRWMARGTPVRSEDLKVVTGRVDTLPARTAMTEEEIIDAITLRDIMPDQPVTLMMVRQPWRVKAGQEVRVMAAGEGFTVTSTGRAINNAATARTVRVRMSSGEIVSGKVDAAGMVIIH